MEQIINFNLFQILEAYYLFPPNGFLQVRNYYYYYYCLLKNFGTCHQLIDVTFDSLLKEKTFLKHNIS